MKAPDFSRDSIRAILENPFSAGLIARYPRPEFDTEDDVEHPENIPAPHVAGNSREILELHPGQHEALIPVGIWQAAGDLRRQKASSPTTAGKQKNIYVLSGIGRCWECFSATGQEYTLRGSTGGNGAGYYRCAYLHDSALKRPPKKQPRVAGVNLAFSERDATLADRHASLRAEKLEAQVDALMSRLVIPSDWHEAILAYYLTDEGLTEFEREGYNLRQSLKRYKELHLAGHISTAEYEQQARFITQRLDRLKPSARPDAQEISPLLHSFAESWRLLNNGEKRFLLGTLFAGLYFDHNGTLRRALAHEPFGELLGLPEDGLLQA
jgi:hypothetical protein